MASILSQITGALRGSLPKAKPFSEHGTSGTAVYGGYVQVIERNPLVVGAEKYRTFSEILANTSIVSAGARYFLNLIARPEWSAEPADDSAQAKELAEFAEEILDDMTTPWARVVRRAGLYRFYGFGIHEWIAKRRDDGRIGLRDIEPRPSHTIERWEVDDGGTVIGMWQRSPQTGRELFLPRGKVVYLVDDTLTDSPEGLGLLRQLVEPAERLREYLLQEGTGFLRDLRGIPVGKAPLGELAEAVKAGEITQAQMDAAIAGLKKVVTLEAKDKTTGLVLNSQPYVSKMDSGNSVATTPKWGLELVTGAANGLEDVGKAIHRLNLEMARILGVESLMLGGDSSGNRALSEDKSRNLYLSANSMLRDMRDQCRHDVLGPIWKLNGFPEKLKPRLKSEDVAFRDVEQIAAVMRDMATAGAPMLPDDEAINAVRDLLGVPRANLDAMMTEHVAEVRTRSAEPDADDAMADEAAGNRSEGES